jgi:hypothetical protein
MKIDAIFFVLVLSLSYTLSVKVLSVDIMTPILKMDTQLSQLKVELKSPSNLTKETFIEKIENMIKEIEHDQAKHVLINNKMAQQCTEEEKFRKMEISDAKEALNASSDSHNRCTQSLAAAKSFLPQLERSVLSYKTQIKVKTDEREAQHKKYLELKKEWDNAITFLKSFVNKIDDAVNNGKPAALIQLNESLIKHASKLGKIKDILPIFIAIEKTINSSSKTNQKIGSANNSSSVVLNSTNTSVITQTKSAGFIKETTQNITNTTTITTVKEQPLSDNNLINLRTVVQNLVNILTVDSHEADVQEDNQQKIFEKLIQEFNLIISELELSITRIKTQIKDMENCIVSELAIINSASLKENRNSKLLVLAERTCTDFFKSFVDATTNRARQIEVVKDIIIIVKRRFGQLPSNFMDELNSANAHFKHYVNSTEFQKYVEIVQVKIPDNLRGRTLSNN